MAKVYVSSVIPFPAADVWRRIRDFNALPAWHPMIGSSKIEGGRAGDTVGGIRSFSLKDGGVIREQCLALSDAERSVTYSILEAPVPVKNYLATLRLREVTDGAKTFAEWTAEFGAPADQEADLVKLVTSIFQSGLDSLKRA